MELYVLLIRLKVSPDKTITIFFINLINVNTLIRAMSNFSSYSVFLDFNVVRGLCWSMAVISVPCNIIVIIRFILLNYQCSGKLSTKTFYSSYQSRFSISHNPSIFLLFNLAIGDLISSLYLLLLAIGDVAYTNYYQDLYGSNSNYSAIRNDWVISPICTISRILSQLALLISIILTFTVAVDRFILVVLPRSRRKITMKRAYVITTVSWLFAIMISITVGLISAQSAAKQSSTYFDIICHLCNMELFTNNFVYIFAYLETFSGFALHLTSMILYIIIYRKLKKSQQKFSTTSSNRAEKRISIILSSIVLTNVLTYVPITMITIVGHVYPSYSFIENQVFPSIVFLLYLNAVINPILLLSLSAKIGWHTRQIGQSSDCNPSINRLNLTYIS